MHLQYRRALAAQREARAKEVLAQTKSMQSTMTVGRKALQVYFTEQDYLTSRNGVNCDKISV